MARQFENQRVRRFRRGLGALRRDVDEELDFHLEMAVRELIAGGLDERSSRREARRRFGDPERHRRECRTIGERLRRAERRGEVMTDLLLDLKFALRTFLKTPGFALVAVLTVALGVAANATIFGMTTGLMFTELPYEDDRSVAFVWTTYPDRGVGANASSAPDFLDLQRRARSLSAVAAHTPWDANLAGDSEPMALTGYRVSNNVFEMLGVQPWLGRGFLPEDDRPGSENVVVLSWRIWNRLGADRGLVGRALVINEVEHTVIGVMPEGFDYPQLNFRGDLWRPLALSETEIARAGSRWLVLVGRLASGFGAEQATAELQRLGEELEGERPESNTGVRFRAVRLRDQLSEPMRPALAVLLVTVGIVLLICCANVANLFLARGATRETEVAIRAALGASRWRVVRQLLTESLLIAVAGGLLGFVLSEISGRILVASLPSFLAEVMPSMMEATEPDPRVFAATMAVALLAGLIFGTLPALRASRPDLNDALRTGSGLAGPRGRNRMRSALVVAEVAMSVILVAGAGLMLKGFVGLLRTDPGFEPDSVLTLRVTLPEAAYPEADSRRLFYDRALREIEAVAGVERAGATSILPLNFSNSTTGLVIEGMPTPEAGRFPSAGYRVITPGYLETMGVDLRSGRMISAADRHDSPEVALVNEAFVRRHFADRDPLQARVRFGRDDAWMSVVGVVADIRHSSLMEAPSPEIYYPYSHAPRQRMYLGARAAGVEPEALTSAVREAIWRVDPTLPIDDVDTMANRVDLSLLVFRLPTNLMMVFGVAALLLAACGLYGVLAYLVAQRTRELGVRMALGAAHADIVRLVLRGSLVLAGCGVLVGSVIAVLLGQVMASILEGVSGADLEVYLGVPAILLAVTLLASLMPLRRAIAVDPVASLRGD